MYHKRKYTPINPQKYRGDPTDIIMRSSWEVKFAIWCDTNSGVLSWGSETTIVPYKCATDGKIRRYYIDFRITIRTKSNEIKTYLVEIKPLHETEMPVFPGRKTKKYLMECFKYAKNKSKWEAADKYARDRGWEFIILTEKHLGIK